jgi:coenzyme F420 hydrogenase subunit beta
MIRKGRFSVVLKEGKKMLDMLAIELAKKWELDLECCLHCTDYFAEFADIAVGGFGSPEGWSTIITRSEKGDRLLNEAHEKGFLECIRQEGPHLA